MKKINLFTVVLLFLITGQLYAIDDWHSIHTLIVEPYAYDFDHPDFINTRINVMNLMEDGRAMLYDVSSSIVNNKTDIYHGTMVLSLDVAGNEDVLFTYYYGDVRKKAFYMHMQSYIEETNVDFVGMSMAFLPRFPSPHREADECFYNAWVSLGDVIKLKSKTLFIVSSGNGIVIAEQLVSKKGCNVDYWTCQNYPARYKMTNVLSVGGVDTYQVVTDKLDTYHLAEFANFGINSIDLLAPAQAVKGAAPNGSYERDDGTSYARAIVTNMAIKIKKRLSHLSILEIKELLLKSTYIPDIDVATQFGLDYVVTKKELVNHPKLLPVRSGGIYFPDRINKTVDILEENPQLTIEQAVLKAREEILGPGEKNDAMTQEKLKSFWQKRQI